MSKKVHVLNLGCSKNQVDSEAILGEFSQAGLQYSEDSLDSDVVVVNTCGFIEDAKQESVDEILGLIENKQPHQKLVVAGCLSQRYLEDLKGEFPEVDLMVGTYKPSQIVESLGLLRAPDNCNTTEITKSRILLGEEPVHAYLKIAEGCNRTCSFCAIPGMRGKQVSKSVKNIIEEAQALQEQGIQEISLIAQDLTFYGREKNGPGSNLTELLQALISETDIPWIRMMYGYPAFINDDLIDMMANEKRICSYLDMPIQHASNNMLKRMRRGHTEESLRKLLLKLRSNVPDIALRTTLLLGFPGETEEDVKTLINLMDEIKFDRLGCFPYSDEEGTHAFDAFPKSDHLSEEVIQDRISRVMTRQADISLERNESLIGKELEVLIDSEAEGSDYHFFARTQWDAPEVDNRVCILEGSATPGSFRKVQILSASEYDLEARLID